MKIILKSEKVIYFLLAAFLTYAAIYQVFYKIDRPTIKIWDEASSAQNAIEMLGNNNYLVVYRDSLPDHFDTRPPMAVWTKVISYKFFGINELSVRLPTIIAAILTIFLLLYFVVRHLKDIKYGIAILFLIASTAGYNTYHVARTGDPDAILVFFVSIYIVIYFLLLEYYPKSRIKYYALLFLAVTSAFYTKSILGLAPLAGLAVYTLTQKNGYRILKDYRFHITWLATLLVIFLYYFLREIYDPGYFQAVIAAEFNTINNPVLVKHPEFEFYYNYLMKVGFSPFLKFWYIPFIAMLFSKNKTVKRLLFYSFLGASAFILGNSSVTIKNEWYIAPVYPFLWLFFGVGTIELVKILTSWIKLKYFQPVIFIVLFGLTFYWLYPVFDHILYMNSRFNVTYIYEPEREGEFLNEIKTERPEYKDLSVVTIEHPRQLKFYIKKFNYLDSTKTTIFTGISNDLIGCKVIVCNDELEKELASKYTFKILEESKYCKLCEITGLDTTNTYNSPLGK